MDVRLYRPSDRIDCLAVFDSNTPDYLNPEDRSRFVSFLDGLPGPFFVLEHEGSVLGCGGYTVGEDARVARLVWGTIRRDMHSQGLGRYLLLYRLREIGKLGTVDRVHVATPPHAAAYFEKQGFRAAHAVPAGSAYGAGRIELVKRLSVCA